jgi:acetoin utilization deacetylase AcuC-like enzyme
MEQVENAERAEIVINPPFGIIHRRSLKNVRIIKDISPATLGDIVRVHDSNYIGEVKKACSVLNVGDLAEYDGDTHISYKTWESSIYAAGACIEAAKRVMKKEIKNAFCCIRPPGHHAGVFGKVEIDKEEFQAIKLANPNYTVEQ